MKNPGHSKSGNHNGHEWVDLGLPSGILWAKYNIGANDYNENGEYFAWGETSVQRDNEYRFMDYKWRDQIQNNKYSFNGLESLEDEDDVAHVRWGGRWKMPTQDDFLELLHNCTFKWIDYENIHGVRAIGPNGKSIFLQAGGFKEHRKITDLNIQGAYWSSTKKIEVYQAAYVLRFYSKDTYFGSVGRHFGLLVRPVLDKK